MEEPSKSPGSFKPKISSNVRFRFLKEDERGRFYIIEKAERGRKPAYLKIHEAGKEIISLMNGELTLAQIDEALKNKNVEVELAKFVELLGRRGFIQDYANAEKTRTEEKAKLRVRNIPIIKNPEGFIAKIYSVSRPFFNRNILVLFAAFNIGMPILACLCASLGAVNLSLGNALVVGDSAFLALLLYTIVFFPLLIFLHELAHSITCFHYGGKIGEIGLSIYLSLPLFYADTSGAWMLSKKQSTMVFLAGPLSSVFIGNVSLFLLFFVPRTYSGVLLMMMFASYFSTLFGLNPLMETDGYYILQALTDFPNLQSNAWSHIEAWMKRKLGKSSKEDYEEHMSCFSRRELRILSLYAPLVAIVNVAFFSLIVLWSLLLTNEYGRITLQLATNPASINITTAMFWVIETFYLLIMIFFISRWAYQIVINRRNAQKSMV